MSSQEAQPKEKTEKERVREKKVEFKTKVDELIQHYRTLKALRIKLQSGGKGAVLKINTNPPVEINAKVLARAETDFEREIKEMYAFFEESLKRKRKSVEPSDFSGVYSPVYAGPALLKFFSKTASFGPLDPNHPATTGLLMDSLVGVQGGYLMRNTINMLFWIHAYVTGSIDPNDGSWSTGGPDFQEAFNDPNTPAVYFTEKSKKSGKKVKWVKYLMNDALERGKITRPLTTFEVLDMTHGTTQYDKSGEDISFNPGRFKAFYFNSIAGLNYYSGDFLEAVPEQAEILNAAETRAGMLNEHNLVKEVSKRWSEYRKQQQQQQ